MVEALLVIASLRGEMLGRLHLGAPPYKLFTSMKACQEWLDTDEGSEIVVGRSNEVRALYQPVTIQVIPGCYGPPDQEA